MSQVTRGLMIITLFALWVAMMSVALFAQESDRCEFLHIDKAIAVYQSEMPKEQQRIVRLNRDYTYAVVSGLAKYFGMKDTTVSNDKIASGALFFYGRDKQFMFMSLDKYGNMCGMVTYPYHVFVKYIEPSLGETL